MLHMVFCCALQRAVHTTELTKALGWEGAHALVQRDVFECMTEILTTLGESVKGKCARPVQIPLSNRESAREH